MVDLPYEEALAGLSVLTLPRCLFRGTHLPYSLIAQRSSDRALYQTLTQ